MDKQLDDILSLNDEKLKELLDKLSILELEQILDKLNGVNVNE